MTPLFRQRILFAILCVTWGGTWLGMKAGGLSAPPAMFAGLRWTVAGLVMLGLRAAFHEPVRLPPRLWGRMLVVALLMITLNAAINMYAVRMVGSGLASVLNCAITPLALLGFGIAAHQERFTGRQAAAIAMGIAGVLIVFGPRAAAQALDPGELAGAALIIVSTLCYTGASVLARPLMRSVAPAQLSAVVNASGGIMLLAAALLFEPGAIAALDLRWGQTAWIAFLFLVGPAAVGASTIYLMLVRDWGPSRTGTYAFVSPVIAVLLGVAVYGEGVGPAQAVGMVLMLAAAGLALRRPPVTVALPSPRPAGYPAP